MLIIVYTFYSFCRYLAFCCAIFHPPQKNKVHFTLKTTHTSTQDAVTVASSHPPTSPPPRNTHINAHTHRPLSVLIFSSGLVTICETPPPPPPALATLSSTFFSSRLHLVVYSHFVKLFRCVCVYGEVLHPTSQSRYYSWIQSPCSHLWNLSHTVHRRVGGDIQLLRHMPRPLVLHRLVHIEAGNLTEESLNINIGPGGEMSFKETGATQLVPPGLTGFGSTMRGGIKSLLFSMPYLQKQRSREEGVWGGDII